MPKSTISLYNADCYEKIKEIPDNSVDLVIIDKYLGEVKHG